MYGMDVSARLLLIFFVTFVISPLSVQRCNVLVFLYKFPFFLLHLFGKISSCAFFSGICVCFSTVKKKIARFFLSLRRENRMSGCITFTRFCCEQVIYGILGVSWYIHVYIGGQLTTGEASL